MAVSTFKVCFLSQSTPVLLHIEDLVKTEEASCELYAQMQFLSADSSSSALLVRLRMGVVVVIFFKNLGTKERMC